MTFTSANRNKNRLLVGCLVVVVCDAGRLDRDLIIQGTDQYLGVSRGFLFLCGTAFPPCCAGPGEIVNSVSVYSGEGRTF
jgi:hypothetical protein